MLDMSLDEIAQGDTDKPAKKSGPHDAGVNGSRRVFVGNLPYSASWQDLKDVMRAAGKVLHCDIIAQPGTAMGSKGCGLVEFSTAEEAQRAIAELHDTHMNGRPIFVREDREEGTPIRNPLRDVGAKPSRGSGGGSGNPCVFVGNLAYSVTWQDLKDHMRRAGRVVRVDIMEEPGTALNSKGCALVRYETGEEARHATRDLTESVINGRAIFVREDREAAVNGYSQPRYPAPRSSRGGRRGCSSSYSRSRSRSRSRDRRRSRRDEGNRRVFVGNLPYSATWKDLKDHMRQAGDVLHADIVAQPGTAMGSKGCGLVEFASARDAPTPSGRTGPPMSRRRKPGAPAR